MILLQHANYRKPKTSIKGIRGLSASHNAFYGEKSSATFADALVSHVRKMLAQDSSSDLIITAYLSEFANSKSCESPKQLELWHKIQMFSQKNLLKHTHTGKNTCLISWSI